MRMALWPLLAALAACALGIAAELSGTEPSSRFFFGGSVLRGSRTASQNPDDVRFFLFSNPSDANEAEEIEFNNTDSLTQSAFECSQVTKILVHGFTGNGLEPTGFPANVKEEYLKKYPDVGYNIISVDWGPLAKCANPLSYLCYWEAAWTNVRIVGRRVGEFILWLQDYCGPDYLDSVHVIGFSLGAHISGYARHTVTQMTGSRIGRLTGLDPAGPRFIKNAPPPAPRMMRASDGNFTDVYHTAAGGQGTPCTVGHLDLFVNGGFTPQPDCGLSAGCSHSMSHVYYANSIAFGDPATNSNAAVQACRLNSVHCLAFAPNLMAPDACDETVVYGEYLEPGTALGSYCVGYPSPRSCLGGRAAGWSFFNVPQ